MSTFIQTLFAGLRLGSIYALVALGHTMVYGIIRLINFAHGDFIMVGGYTMIFAAGGISFAGVTLEYTTLLTVVISAIVMVALFQLTQRTRLGRAMRCVPEDKEAATLMGINVNHTVLATFAIGSGLAAVAALMYMAQYAILRIIIMFRPKGIFGALKAVQDFNIQIYQGELVGLIGLNGAGKTTVFNLLTGVYVPTETAELLKCISTIRDRFGAAILLIEHDMYLVMNACERIQVIDYGQTIASGLPEEIANDPKVIAAYLGE